jgi:hypothetical protein
MVVGLDVDRAALTATVYVVVAAVTSLRSSSGGT